VLQEPGELAAGVGGEVVVIRPEHVEMVDRELAQGVQHARVVLHRGDELRPVVAAEQRRVDVVGRGLHPVVGVPGTVVGVEDPLDHGQVSGLLAGAVDQRDRLGEDLAVGVADGERARVGEEGVQRRSGDRGQVRAVLADRIRLVELHVPPGPQIQHQLLGAGAVVTGIGPGVAAERGRHGDHLGFAEQPERVVTGGREQIVDARGGGRRDL
jgi:hypothetical protein